MSTQGDDVKNLVSIESAVTALHAHEKTRFGVIFCYLSASLTRLEPRGHSFQAILT